MTRIVATVEARMTSTRLPGKVLLPAAGEPLLTHLLRRVLAVDGISDVVVATTVNTADDPIVACAIQHGAQAYRGSEDDVLGRVTCAAEERSADVVVALTADNPLVDPHIICMVLDAHLQYGTSITANNFEQTFPDGMDVQVMSIEALRAARDLAETASDHEHLTQVIRSHPEQFSRHNVLAPEGFFMPELSVTVDEPDDYRLVCEIVERLGSVNPIFGCEALIALIRSDPRLVKMNKRVQRRY
jgi:spore coat polysaccharide biosynthesis protein SpsF